MIPSRDCAWLSQGREYAMRLMIRGSQGNNNLKTEKALLPHYCSLVSLGLADIRETSTKSKRQCFSCFFFWWNHTNKIMFSDVTHWGFMWKYKANSTFVRTFPYESFPRPRWKTLRGAQATGVTRCGAKRYIYRTVYYNYGERKIHFSKTKTVYAKRYINYMASDPCTREFLILIFCIGIGALKHVPARKIGKKVYFKIRFRRNFAHLT